MTSSPPLPSVCGIQEEDASMGTCSCSGSWHLSGEEVVPADGRWLDFLRMVCVTCGSRRTYMFDITPFFVPRRGVWSSHYSVGVAARTLTGSA
jgi:hypothetical protein